MEDVNRELRPMAISDQPENESQLRIDTKIGFVSLPLIVPLFLVAAGIIGTLLLPPYSCRLTQNGPFPARASASLSRLSGWSAFVSVSLTNSTAISGSLNVSALRQSLPVLEVSSHVPPTAGGDVRLFFHDIVDFDTLDVNLRPDRPATFSLLFEFGNPAQRMAVSLARVVFSAVFVPYLIAAVFRVARRDSEVSLEPILTNALSLFTICFIDPFYVVQLFQPTPAGQTCHIVLRDVYFGYIAFYAVALFAHFTPQESELLNWGFPVALMGITVTALLVQDFYFREETRAVMMPREGLPAFDSLTLSHVYLFAALLMIVVARAATVRTDVWETKVQRFRLYCATTMVFLGAMVGLVAFEKFASEVAMMGVVSAFAFLMEYFHTEVDEGVYDMFDVNDEPLQNVDGELGADEDTHEVGEGVKKGALGKPEAKPQQKTL
jgi:hypothetical protein